MHEDSSKCGQLLKLIIHSRLKFCKALHIYIYKENYHYTYQVFDDELNAIAHALPSHSRHLSTLMHSRQRAHRTSSHMHDHG